MKGLSVGKTEDKMGMNGAAVSELILDEVRAPKSCIMGNIGDGFKIAMSGLDGGRIGIASQAFGLAQGALEEAIKYSKERVQFGKPIVAQQGISFKLADMATSIEAARLLTYQAAWLESEGLPYGKESAMSKLFAGDAAMKEGTFKPYYTITEVVIPL
jgi:alkylation response protein AidB-like acyl-CoA dehydrogenase